MSRPKDASGYFVVLRELWEHRIWDMLNPNQKVILFTVLRMAKWKDSEMYHYGTKQKVKVARGSFVASLETIAKKADRSISARQCGVALNVLSVEGFIAQSVVGRVRTISICNYNKYQLSTEKDVQSDVESNVGKIGEQMESNWHTLGKDKKEKKKEGKVPATAQPGTPAHDLAILWIDLLLEHSPDHLLASKSHREKAVASYAMEFDRAHRIDGRSYEQMEKVARWMHRDSEDWSNGSSWRANCQSARKFRRQFDTLMAQSKVQKIDPDQEYRLELVSQIKNVGQYD